MLAAAPTPSASEPVGVLWQHGETGRTRVEEPGQVFADNRGWHRVGPLYLHPAPTPPELAEQADAIPVAELFALLPYAYYMDPPDGGDVSVVEQLSRMARDAARYRHMRDQIGWTLISANGLTRVAFRLPVAVTSTHDEPDELDAAIDAAMQEPT